MFAHIFKEVTGGRILFYLALLKDNRKLIDGNILGDLLELYNVKMSAALENMYGSALLSC